MNTITALEKSMILAIAHSQYTPNNGGEINEPSQSLTWTSDIVENSQDKGVFSSLVKKELIYHSGEGRDSTCVLTDAGFEVYLQVREQSKSTDSDLDKALDFLVSLVARGVEYPDAHTEACIKYRVDGDLLTSAYDDL